LKAVREQLDRQAIHSQELIDPLRTHLAHLVALITPGDLNFVFLTNSGTESMEGCLKLAVLTTARHHFVGAIGGFHGKSLGSLGGTSKAMFREPFLPMQHWTHVPFGDGSALRSAVACADFTGDPVRRQYGRGRQAPRFRAQARGRSARMHTRLCSFAEFRGQIAQKGLEK
jgi:putrescine aminotransferase